MRRVQVVAGQTERLWLKCAGGCDDWDRHDRGALLSEANYRRLYLRSARLDCKQCSDLVMRMECCSPSCGATSKYSLPLADSNEAEELLAHLELCGDRSWRLWDVWRLSRKGIPVSVRLELVDDRERQMRHEFELNLNLESNHGLHLVSPTAITLLAPLAAGEGRANQMVGDQRY